jgi:FkbM family methyltransferase
MAVVDRSSLARLATVPRLIGYVGVAGLAGVVYHGLRAAVARNVLGRRHIRRRIHDYDMLLDTRDRGISRTLILFGRRELEHRVMLQELIRPGMTIFDVGANIGYYVLMESRLLRGSGHIVAVEPCADNAGLLRRNLALNRVTAVTVVEAAVSDAEGRRELQLSPFSNRHSFHPVASQSDHRSTRVRTTTVVALAREFGPPDLIRMDVEGHEVEILDALVPAIQPGALAPTIVFEVHRTRYSSDHDFSRTLRLLFEQGYRVALMGSSQASGTRRLMELGYRGGAPIPTDFTTRVIFRDIHPDHATDIICRTGGARTVVLAPPPAGEHVAVSNLAPVARPSSPPNP